MTSNRFDPDAAAGSLQEAHLVSSPELRAKIIDPVVAGALVDISISLRKLTDSSKPVAETCIACGAVGAHYSYCPVRVSESAPTKETK